MSNPNEMLELADKIVVTENSVNCHIPSMGWRKLPEVENCCMSPEANAYENYFKVE